LSTSTVLPAAWTVEFLAGAAVKLACFFCNAGMVVSWL
jgi:hypothetical protein